MKIKNYFLLLIIILSNTSIFCQSEIPIIIGNVNVHFYKRGFTSLIHSHENEINVYTTDYSKRCNAIVNKVVSEPKYNFIKIHATSSNIEQRNLDSIGYILHSELINSYQSKGYKRIELIKPPQENTLKILNYLGKKYNTNVIGFINIIGEAKEKPDKKGNYDKNAKGKFYINCYFLDVKTGRFLFNLPDGFPDSSITSDGHISNKYAIMDEFNIEKMVRSYLKRLNKKYIKFQKETKK
jgi:hypothetical protein